ncbi:MAG: hypothetical protein CFE44_19980 [Burkholderiales bacterium PBB4]|nr:MAG: hypothetical protein CFE44_19980 [Burkholderiales bacterium PBB4]
MSRIDTRHNHISIGLRFLAEGGQWEHFEALGWNEVGFNFYHAREILEPALELKRGLTAFAGTITWHSLNTSEEVALGALVNAEIYKRAQEVQHNDALRERLIKLIRVPGMVPEKRKVLASLGLDISDSKLAEMWAQKRKDQPLHHYGVKVDSDAWRAIVKNALSISSVVISLEKWADSFGPK